MLLLAPVGILDSEWQTTLKCPSNHVQSSEDVSFPPGPMGPGLISPSPVFPDKISEPLVHSGPGLACDGA